MEYLKGTLGIHVSYIENDTYLFPNYIASRYKVKKVKLDSKKAAFVYPIAELDPISSVKKHIERIENDLNTTAILILDSLTSRQKEYLLRYRIPFVVDRRQIYLPFMAIYLQEKCDAEKKKYKEMLPSSQMLLLYFIYNSCNDTSMSEACKALSLTPTSISRASKQLEELELIKVKKLGVQKIIYSDSKPKELFAIAKKYLLNPVKETVYIPKKYVKDNLLLSNLSAVSEYAFLNPPNLTYLATNSISKWNNIFTTELQSRDDEYAVELWRYNPKILSKTNYVDKLSLVLSLNETFDERVESSIEQILSQIWEEINDKRN